MEKFSTFMKLSFMKFIENLVSMKFWIIFSYLVLSTCGLYAGKLDGKIWAESNGAIISIVLAIREGIKVTKIRSVLESNGNPEAKQEIRKISV